MIPSFASDGDLPAGIHEATWSEFVARFGWTPHRSELLGGLESGLRALKSAGCRTVYLGGSFVTNKESVHYSPPRDFDVCWDEDGVDVDALPAVFFDFTVKRAAQRRQFGGEFFPSSTGADHTMLFIEYFQQDTRTGRPKGIIKIQLETLT